MTKLKLGVMASLEKGPEATIKDVHDFGLPTCQAVCWQEDLLTVETADRMAAAAEKYNVEVTTVWTGTPGVYVWDFVRGPVTIGLVPLESQEARIAALKAGADVAAR
ncbi:MAG: sugar phosphate isomerase/epimerase, partial [Anaerolineae bacterium]|nr:sugar phosphate isomerase/epimerase [Anaerolineae bacterium]